MEVEVRGVQERVAVELERVAMEVVRALLDGRGNNAARVTVILGIQRSVDQVELVDCVQARRQRDGVQRNVIGVGAVDQEL